MQVFAGRASYLGRCAPRPHSRLDRAPLWSRFAGRDRTPGASAPGAAPSRAVPDVGARGPHEALRGVWLRAPGLQFVPRPALPGMPGAGASAMARRAPRAAGADSLLSRGLHAPRGAPRLSSATGASSIRCSFTRPPKVYALTGRDLLRCPRCRARLKHAPLPPVARVPRECACELSFRIACLAAPGGAFVSTPAHTRRCTIPAIAARHVLATDAPDRLGSGTERRAPRDPRLKREADFPIASLEATRLRSN